jgi:hypothetical protein
LGLAAYCTLADSFRNLKKRGKGCETRHARRVRLSTLSIDADDVVEDRRKVCLVFSGAELPYPRLERQMGCVDGCVKYPDAHIEDYPLPVCDGRDSPSAPRFMCVSVLVTYSMYYSDSLSHLTNLPLAHQSMPRACPHHQVRYRSLTRNLLRVNRNKPLTCLSARGLSRDCLGDR